MKLFTSIFILSLLYTATSFALPAYNVRAAGDFKVEGTLYLKDGTPMVSSDGLLKNRGDFVPATEYFAGDVVQFAGNSFVCILANIAVPPFVTTNWSPLALQGPTGSQGIQGIQGATGPQGVKGDTGSQGLQGAQGIQGLAADSKPPALFKPANFNTSSMMWQYLLYTTATNTTLLTSGDYIVPDGVYYVTIEAIGGAGGGSGCNVAYLGLSGCGGGSAEYAGTYLAVKPGSTINISYGVGGSNGAPGTDSQFVAGGWGTPTIVTYNSIVYVKANSGRGATFNNFTHQCTAGGGGSGSTDLQHADGASGETSAYTWSVTGGGSGPNPTNALSNIGGSGGVCSTASPATVGSAGVVAISYMKSAGN